MKNLLLTAAISLAASASIAADYKRSGVSNPNGSGPVYGWMIDGNSFTRVGGGGDFEVPDSIMFNLSALQSYMNDNLGRTDIVLVCRDQTENYAGPDGVFNTADDVTYERKGKLC